MKKAFLISVGFLAGVALVLNLAPNWRYTMPLPQGGGTITITTYSGLVPTLGFVAVFLYYCQFRAESRALRDSVPWPQRRRDYLDITYFGFLPVVLGVHALLQVWVALSDSVGVALMQHIARTAPVVGWAYSPMLFIRDALIYVLVVPTLEEIAFRAILYERLKKLSGVWVAALLSSLVFAVCHPYSAGFLAVVFVMGLVLCWMYQSSGILCAITLHTAANAVVIFTFFALYHIHGVPLP